MSQIQVELQAVYGTDKEVANSAWTSSLDYQKKQQRNNEDIKRVVNMLADNKHSTPFESIIFRWWIKMPIATDRQFMTHRLQSSSGMSGRYRTMPNEYLIIPEDVSRILERFDRDAYFDYNKACDAANRLYASVVRNAKVAEKEGLISNSELKRIREFYRGVLPQHNMTERVSIMNLRAWSNFYKLRSSSHAQPEIQLIAKFMRQELDKYPEIIESVSALERNGWNI